MMLDELLPLVKGVKKSGAGYLGPCAAHADKSPSLSIREGESGLLLKCWAGCTIDEICRALGIQQRDLFYDALDANPRQRQAAEQPKRRCANGRPRQTEPRLTPCAKQSVLSNRVAGWIFLAGRTTN